MKKEFVNFSQTENTSNYAMQGYDPNEHEDTPKPDGGDETSGESDEEEDDEKPIEI
ncbi:hypothetical protein [Aquimarina rhabdastrellae]